VHRSTRELETALKRYLGVRQCQWMFRQLGFRLRKPRPLIAHADADLQKTHKKTSGAKP
jgi:hypothetical protein